MPAPVCPHLTFHRLTAANLADFLAIARDDHVRRYLLDGALVDHAWAEAVLAASDALFAERGVGLHLLEHANVLAGFAGFHVFDEHGREPQLLYALLPAHTGRGLATEAASALIRAARDRGFERVIAAVDEPNAASIRVLEKLGFARTHEGPGEFGRTFFFARAWAHAPE